MTILDKQLLDFTTSCDVDPLRWVRYAYPWGKGELEERSIYTWQEDMLGHIAHELSKPWDENTKVVRAAVSSGHGVGKSTMTSWMTDWAMSTKALTRVVLTANTEAQLKQKTWAEMAKWRRLSVTRDWFKIKAMSMYSPNPMEMQNWRADLVPWSEYKPESFAGLHNLGRRILLIFDEAAAIPRVIWETAEGALTDENTEILWLVYGNPTRNSGPFAECFKSRAHLWHNVHIDSRDVPGTNKKLIAEWEAVYGEDSDFFRVRVKGQFPRQSSLQFISEETITEAKAREATSTPEDPVIIGVDLARRGESRTVLYTRQGRDAKRLAPKIIADSSDSMHLAAQIAEYLNEQRPDQVFMDGGGLGGPICDRMRQLGYDVVEVQFGGVADNSERYSNKRSEMWARMKDWLQVGAIWDSYEMDKEFAVCEADTDRTDRVRLETKESLIERGESSPDISDALALTFAYPVVSRRAGKLNVYGRQQAFAETEYEMYEETG